MTTSSLTWVTPAGSIGVFLENTIISKQFEATPGSGSNTVTYTLLNGNLPSSSTPAITLSSSGLLYGELGEVAADVVSEFTIRATEKSGATVVAIRDRTFSIKVTGQTAPYFTTPPGLLFTTNDSVWQSVQLGYDSPDPNTSPVVSLVNGSLPPGLEINSAGLIRGYANIPSTSTATYSFSLQVSSESGTSLPVEYSITVINQASLSGFTGRNPTLLNTQPRSFTISTSDPYYSYYLSGDSLGQYIQDNKFIFKFIGYDFDAPTVENTLIYDINGLESIGITNNTTTGWQTGTLPTIGESIQTYNITARVYKQADSTLSSETFLLSITVVGDIDSTINWVTVTNLGTINNGSVSEKSVLAVNTSGTELRYRITSSTILSNLRTIVGTGATTYNAFGEFGSHVIGDGDSWTNQPPLNTQVSSYNFNTSIYDSVNSNIVIGGADQNNNATIGKLSSTGIWTPSAVITSQPINDIAYNGSIYVAVGDAGTIVTTADYDSWLDARNSTVTVNLNDVCWDGTQFVAVGSVGTIITSPNGVTWTQRTSGVTRDLTSVFYTNTNLIAVGDFGTILQSADGISWNLIPLDTTVNFNTVTGNYQIDTVTVVAGQDGTLYRSLDHGLTWTNVINVITTTDLYDLIYNNDQFLCVGDAGTVLVYSYDTGTGVDTVSSPTLDILPPNLQLLSTGEIAGRLAFESTDTEVPIGTSKTYTFSIQAYSPTISDINSIKQFTLTTYQEFNQPYDNLYIQCYADVQDRAIIDSLLNDSAIIPTADLYRPDDAYFGKAKSVIYQHMFGVPSVATDDFYAEYINAITKNFYWRNITLGQLKTAVARDSDNNIIYEVVYSEVIDNLVNPQGVSIQKEIVWPRSIKIDNSDWWTSTTDIVTSNDDLYTSLSSELSRELFPNSLVNMREQIADTIGFFNNSDILPAWMTSQQVDGNILGYTQAWVICYTKPGKAQQIKTNIETNWDHTLNEINFQIDRFEVDRSMTYNYNGIAISGYASYDTMPSAQPFPSPSNSEDKYVLITQKTILPEIPSV